MTNSSTDSLNSASVSGGSVSRSTTNIIEIITCGQPSRSNDNVPSKSNSTERNPPRGRSGRSTSMSGGNSISQAPPVHKGDGPEAKQRLLPARPLLLSLQEAYTEGNASKW